MICYAKDLSFKCFVKAVGTCENCKGKIATTSLRTGRAMTHQEVQCKNCVILRSEATKNLAGSTVVDPSLRSG